MRARRFARSSIIDRASYDRETATLCICFRDTGKYLYFDVPPEIYEDLCRAGSAGAFFNERIKSHFRCRRDPERKYFGPKRRLPGSQP